MTICDACKSTEVESCNGQVYCAKCGKVLDTNSYTNDVQFLENGKGGNSILGTLVRADGCVKMGGPGRYHFGYNRESRLVTLNAAKQRLQNLAAQLRIENFYVEMAHRYFKMALNKGLTKGRKADYVAAACLYTACRTADGVPLPYMLLDFSDALQADVYALGHVYLQLCKELCILQPTMQVHSPDPAIFIERYAHKLEFGDKTLEVSKTATRLVSRMKRDWLVQGRRPSGICGAALLVAARIYDFNRTIKDVMKVVRIGEGTIKKRLVEFEQTPSSSLTIDQFLYQNIDLSEEMDPPSYTEGKRKAKLSELEEKGELPHLMEEVERIQGEIEAVIEETIQRKNKKYRKYTAGADNLSLCSMPPSLSEIDEELAQYGSLLPDDFVRSFIEEENCGSSKKFSTKKEKRERDEQENGTEDERDLEVEDMVEKELNGIIQIKECLGPRPTAASLGIKETIDDCLTSAEAEAEVAEDDNNGELDLTDINEAELDKLILNEEEVKIKTTIWMRENADFLKEMKEKEERKAKELLENPQPTKKRRVIRKRGVKTEARSAREAMEKMLQEKKISNKINYDVLKNLNLVKPVSMLKTEDSIKRNSTEAGLLDDVEEAKRLKLEKSVKNDVAIEIPAEPLEDYDAGEEEDYDEYGDAYDGQYEGYEDYGDYGGYDDD